MAITQMPNHLQPTQGKNLYSGNYLDFFNLAGGGQWAQQFLPDVYEKEVEIYGNRTISGFLKMVSAEMPSTSDQIIWLEQGRLHTRYANIALTQGTALSDAGATANNTALGTAAINDGAAIKGTIAFTGINVAPTSETDTTEGSAGNCNFRVGQTVMVGVTGGTGAAANKRTIKGVVTAVDGPRFVFALYNEFTPVAGDNSGATALVYGSEFAKGSGNFTEKIDPSYTTYSNAPIIMKEHYAINGSDTSQIGWVEVTSENGASGYLWYVKAEHENRLRWEDYQEMAMVEGVKADADIAEALNNYRGDFANTTGYNRSATGLAGTARGTEGFFQALENRGNVYDDLSGDLALNGAAQGLGAFDEILRQLDKQGAIEENMLYVNRDLSLAFSDMLSGLNNYGGGDDGVSWGVFNNSKDMALDLHFSGFRRGSYDFYQTDWKYLNDYSTRGGFGDIEGVMIPAGTSTVYDQNLGKNIKRPFLHVRYRSSETDNRKMKSWITGSVGGAYTTDVDEMRMHYLTERCLITQGANNFFLLQA